MTIEVRMCPDGLERAFALDRHDPLHQDNLPAWFDASKGVDAIQLVVFFSFIRRGTDPRTLTRRQVSSAIRELDRKTYQALKKSEKEFNSAIKRWKPPS